MEKQKMKLGNILLFGIVVLALAACNSKEADAHGFSFPHSHGNADVAHVSGSTHTHDDQVSTNDSGTKDSKKKKCGEVEA